MSEKYENDKSRFFLCSIMRSLGTIRPLQRKTTTIQAYQIILSPSFLLLFTLVILPIPLHFIWALPCIIINGTIHSDQKPCCNPAIITNAGIVTGLLTVVTLVSIFVLRCFIGESCYCTRSIQRRFIDVSILNIIGYMFFISALIMYSVEETLIICKGWSSTATKIMFFWLLFLGILCLVASNICFLCLFVEQSTEESSQISD